MAITKVQPFNLNPAATYTFGNVNVNGFISSTGNITASYIVGNGSQLTNVTASDVGVLTTLSVSGNVSSGNITANGIITATGNIIGDYFIGNGSQLSGIDATSIQNGTSNVRVLSAGGDVAVGIGGISNIAVFASTGQYVTGLISSSGNVTGANILTGGTISATGNAVVGNLSATNISGTLTTASQNNITSVGTLTSLNSGAISSSGNITGANILTNGMVTALGNVYGGNVIATEWVKGANISTGGNVLVNGYISVVGNLYVSNVVASSNLVVQDPLVYLTANATFPYNYDIGFYSQFTGNPGNTYQHTGLVRDYTDDTWKLFSNVVPEPTSGSVDLTNAIYDPLVMGALTATSGSFSSVVSATGNVTGGNIRTGGLISATGNITGNYFIGNGSQLSGITSTTVANDTSSNVTLYPTMSNSSSGSFVTAYVSDSKLTFNPSTGDLSATNFNSLSDQRRKTDIETIVEAVELLMHLRGVYFRWIDSGRRSMGMIAQEVEQIIPEIVSTAEDGTKSIAYGSVVGLLVEVVKDHEIRLQRLEGRR